MRVAIPIRGLGLGGCGAEQVERALRSLSGVVEAYVNRANEVAYITLDLGRVSATALPQCVEATGFRVEPPETWRLIR
jgi:hypothetical protein